MAAVLVLLAGRAAGDATVRDLPCQPFPALSAASLIYALVPSPLGGGTWAEQQVEAIRMGTRDRAREDIGSPAARVLHEMHAPTDPPYVPLRTEALREAPPAIAVVDVRMIGAFEAMGLSPEDLVEGPEVPLPALTAAEAILDAIDWGLDGASRLREMLRESPPLRIEEPLRNAKQGFAWLPQEPVKPMVSWVFVKAVVRSIYKILLGIAIGILIWGMVRNSEGGAGEPGTFFR